MTLLLQKEFAFFFIAVHCGSHKTNLAMHVVSKFAIVSRGSLFYLPFMFTSLSLPKSLWSFLNLLRS